ncbi:MAG: hypothetical protein COB41_03675 [Proteobacteria bacterium]|nr:MAG: hypothetical protein COB41_03675 [Pseudomonadota bacterium]
MNKLLMAMLLLGLSACAMYEPQHSTTADEVRDREAGAVIVSPTKNRFDGMDYNDDFGEYDD